MYVGVMNFSPLIPSSYIYKLYRIYLHIQFLLDNLIHLLFIIKMGQIVLLLDHQNLFLQCQNLLCHPNLTYLKKTFIIFSQEKNGFITLEVQDTELGAQIIVDLLKPIIILLPLIPLKVSLFFHNLFFSFCLHPHL